MFYYTLKEKYGSHAFTSSLTASNTKHSHELDIITHDHCQTKLYPSIFSSQIYGLLTMTIDVIDQA